LRPQRQQYDPRIQQRAVAMPPNADTRVARDTYDLLVIGGGVNGAGIARDAAGRGISVLLCEQHDLAAHTSSASTKLIHGGLRYLEHGEFGLVRKALAERETLLSIAGHLVHPLDFVLPHDQHLRPAWMIRAGLFLYDHLARRRRLHGSQAIDLRRHAAGAALQARFARGFLYADAKADDARLVVVNALDARERGATVLTRARVASMVRGQDHWRAKLAHDGTTREVTARALVNAAGPWAARVHAGALGSHAGHGLRLVKGSHIVVPSLYPAPYAYIFQNEDRRIVFAIPYEGAFTLIGTTEVEYHGDPGSVSASAAEAAYLCRVASRYFARPVAPDSIVWTYAGVRPLLADESTEAGAVSRDYALEVDRTGPPLLSVFGGKITTYRRLAEEALGHLAPLLGASTRAWTAGAPLPGGDFPRGGYERYGAALPAQHPALPDALIRRYARLYGTRAARILDGVRAAADLGREVLPGLYERELDYLRNQEWALTARDILWRRTKLGLHLPRDAEPVLDHWLAGAGSSGAQYAR
jgi:glycerol-3-phosphate dehydrogenase